MIPRATTKQAYRRPPHAVDAFRSTFSTTTVHRRGSLPAKDGVRGEIDKSGWHLIKPSRKEAKYYQMNLSFMEMESLVDVEKAVFLCHPPQGPNAPTEPGKRKLKHSSIRLNNNSIVELQGERR